MMAIDGIRSEPTAQHIDFVDACLLDGHGFKWLQVVGDAPCVNMNVVLRPVMYFGQPIRQPDYWEWNVIGLLPHGICLTAVKSYFECTPLCHSIGKKGIEVVGLNNHTLKLDVC